MSNSLATNPNEKNQKGMMDGGQFGSTSGGDGYPRIVQGPLASRDGNSHRAKLSQRAKERLVLVFRKRLPTMSRKIMSLTDVFVPTPYWNRSIPKQIRTEP